MMDWSDPRIVSFMVVGLLIKPESRPRYLVMCKRDEFEFSSRVIAGPWFMIAPFPIYDSRSAVSVSRPESVRKGSDAAGALSLAALWVVLWSDRSWTQPTRYYVLYLSGPLVDLLWKVLVILLGLSTVCVPGHWLIGPDSGTESSEYEQYQEDQDNRHADKDSDLSAQVREGHFWSLNLNRSRWKCSASIIGVIGAFLSSIMICILSVALRCSSVITIYRLVRNWD